MPPIITEPSEVVAPRVTLLVPVYNEALKLMSSLTELYDYMLSIADRYSFELLIVDDGSTDETNSIAAAFSETRPEVRLLTQPVNMRLGQALRDGFDASNGDIVVVFDSDLSYSPDHIGRMLVALEAEHAHVVVASPYMKGGQTSAIPWSREVMSRNVNRLLSMSTLSHVKTVTGMVRAYRGDFVRSLSLKSMGPEINTELLYKAQIMRARVVEVPAHLDWSDQKERLATRKVSLKVSTTSKLLVFASFLFRPIWFFIVPGLALLSVSLWSTASLLWTVLREARKQSGGIDHRLTDGFAIAWQVRPQTFIIAGFTFVVAVQLISLGLLATQAKRYFEELFYSNTRARERLNETTIAPAEVLEDR